MLAALQGLISLLGRVMLCSIFIYSVVMDKFVNFEALTNDLAGRGVPSPKVVLAVIIVLLVLGSVLVILGYWARVGAFLLAAALGVITYWFYPFWQTEELAARQLVMLHFMKNVSIAGAMVMILANGPGAWSLDVCCAPDETPPATTPKPM